MKSQNIEVDVLINQRPVRQFGHAEKTFIEAKVGSEYSLRIRNNNSGRVLAIVSVDGISVESGKEANYNSAGYIIAGYSSIEVKGYRKDLNTVGAFKFTQKKKSYAKGVSGSTQNVGVISVATFAEKVKPVPAPQIVFVDKPYFVDRPYPVYPKYRSPWYETWYSTTLGSAGIAQDSYTTTSLNYNAGDTLRGASNSSYKMSKGRSAGGGQSASMNFCATASCSLVDDIKATEDLPQFSVGSSWGKKVDDQVTYADFEKSTTTPLAVFEIYYDNRENLEAVGIDFDKKTKVSAPNGFPNQFAQPPATWRE